MRARAWHIPNLARGGSSTQSPRWVSQFVARAEQLLEHAAVLRVNLTMREMPICFEYEITTTSPYASSSVVHRGEAPFGLVTGMPCGPHPFTANMSFGVSRCKRVPKGGGSRHRSVSRKLNTCPSSHRAIECGSTMKVDPIVPVAPIWGTIWCRHGYARSVSHCHHATRHAILLRI